jgi:hypothetical protein
VNFTYRFKTILTGAFVGLFLFSFANVLNATGETSGLLYGQDHAIAFDTPPNWVLDNKSGVEQGLYAVFYPTGSTWANSITIMYLNTIVKKGRTFDQVLAGDAAAFKNTTKMDAGAFPTGDGKKAVVRYFMPTGQGNYEAVAYVNEKNIVALLVMSSRDKAHFQASLPSFQKLIGSYHFLDKTSQTGQKSTVVQYVIPPDIFLIAKDASKSAKGEKYEKGVSAALGPHFAQYMQACVAADNTIAAVNIVLKVEKDGHLSGVFVDGHNAVSDCLAPKFAVEKLPPPPYTPYYELIEVKIR